MSFSLTPTARERIALEAYQSPERPTQAELAKRFGVSQPAIARRIARAGPRSTAGGSIGRKNASGCG